MRLDNYDISANQTQSVNKPPRLPGHRLSEPLAEVPLRSLVAQNAHDFALRREQAAPIIQRLGACGQDVAESALHSHTRLSAIL